MHHDRSLPLTHLCSPLFLLSSPLCVEEKLACTSNFVQGLTIIGGRKWYRWWKNYQESLLPSSSSVYQNHRWHVFHVVDWTKLVSGSWFILGKWWMAGNGGRNGWRNVWRKEGGKKRISPIHDIYTWMSIFAAINLIGIHGLNRLPFDLKPKLRWRGREGNKSKRARKERRCSIFRENDFNREDEFLQTYGTPHQLFPTKLK